MAKDKKPEDKTVESLDAEIQVLRAESMPLIGQKIVASIIDKKDYDLSDFSCFFATTFYRQNSGNYNQNNGGSYDQDGGGNYSQGGGCSFGNSPINNGCQTDDKK